MINESFCKKFLNVVDKYGNKIAVCDKLHEMTYFELNNLSNYLADKILKKTKESSCETIAVALDRSVYTVVSIIAILKAGKTYLPIDCNYPFERVEIMLKQSDTKLMIGNKDFLEKFEIKNICIEDLVGQYDNEVIYREIDLSNVEMVSYIIFTSGTTGVPKGAAITMKGMMNHLYNKIKLLSINENTSIVQNASQCFDISVWQFLALLLMGGQVHILSNEEVRDLSYLIEYLEQKKITIFEAVPSYFSKLISKISHKRCSLSCLEYILLTGEKVSPGLCREWYSLNYEAVIVNAYGPTECSDDITHYIVPRNLDEEVTNIPIGYPIENMQLKVAKFIDKNGMIIEAEDDEKGELIVDGIGVGVGYVNDKENTHKNFFYSIDGNRCYRTGDIVSKDKNNLFRFWGRIDNQIKINGYRIETQEIEEILKKHSGIKDCYVTKKLVVYNQVYFLENKENITDGIKKEMLVAYAIRKGDVNFMHLRQYLESKMPRYMIPEQIIWIEEFPLTENGKINEEKLPPPQNILINNNSNFVPPMNEIEQQMAVIWEEVLGISPIGRMDNFIDLGGDSLAAIETIVCIEERIRKRVSYAKFVLAKNLMELCEQLDENNGIDNVEIIKHVNRKHYNLSFSEEGQYFLWRLEPQSAYYTFQGMLHLYGNIQYKQINNILNDIVCSNDILRSNYVFFEEQGSSKVLKYINRFSFKEFSFFDISELDNPYEKIHMDAQKESQSIFNLEKDPLFRACIYKVGEEKYVVLLTMHEIIMDAWSIYKLIHMFMKRYEDYLLGIPMIKNNIQYQDYAEWEKNNYSKKNMLLERKYWNEVLEGELPILDILLAKERPSKLTYIADSVHVILEKEDYNSITKFCKRNNYTLFSVILGVYFIALSFFSKQNDIIVGCPYANRNTREKENLLGCFLNMLPIREKINEQFVVKDFFDHVSKNVSACIENSNYPFMWMVEDQRVKRSNNISPIFQVMFDMVNFPQINFSGTKNIAMSFEEIDINVRKYDLNLYAYEQTERLFLRLSYLTDLYGKKEATDLLSSISSILKYISENENCYVSEIRKDVLCENDQNQPEVDRRLHGIKETDCSYMMDMLINNPEINKDVVVYEDEKNRVTYGELNKQVYENIGFLKEQGIGEFSLVVIYADKDADTIINMISLLILGATYIPLDIVRDEEYLRILCNNMNVTSVISDIELKDGEYKKIGQKFLYAISQEKFTNHEKLACIIPTSSSSGKEKYVKISKVGFLNRIYGQDVLLYDLSSVKTMISLRSISLVTHIFELFSNLLYGNCLLLIRRNDVLNIRKVVEIIYEHKVDYVVLSPNLLYSIVEEVKRIGKDFDFLTIVCSGSAKLNKKLVENFFEVFRCCKLFNTYGATETSSTVYVQEINENSDIIAGTVIDGMSVCIEDDNGYRVKNGVTGNIVVKGCGVSEGYVDFETDNIYVDCHGEKSYRTGDLGKINERGFLEILGRKDRIVKSRGFKINLSEIEEYCKTYPGVEEVGCMFGVNQNIDGYAVLYVSRKIEVKNNELYEYLKKKYPIFILPQYVLRVEELPHTISGKVQYANLGHLFMQYNEKTSLNEELSMTEKDLKEIICNILNIDKVSKFDNFFMIGGHSLLAIELVTKIEEKFQVTLMISDVYSGNSSIVEMASIIDEQKEKV